jgi:predicted nucleic acid-binding protein
MSTSILCVDASVVVKWLVWETESELAVRMVTLERQLGAFLVGPPHLPIEVTSALYRRLREGDLESYEAYAGVAALAELPIEIVYPPSLPSIALEEADRLGLSTPYDACYLALGVILNCDVWTADAAFYRAAHPHHKRLHLLKDYY